ARILELAWAPLMRAARAEAEADIATLTAAIQRNGCDAAQARMSELERDMQLLAEEIIAAPATSLGGLRAKALVAPREALQAHAFHHGAFEFRDDGASRSLFDAVAVMTGTMPLVRELEGRLAADVGFKDVETGLPGWACEIRTQKCRRKLSLSKVGQMSVDRAESGRRDYSRASCDDGSGSSGLVPGSQRHLERSLVNRLR